MAEKKQKRTGHRHSRNLGDAPPPARPRENPSTARVEAQSDRERLNRARRLPTSGPPVASRVVGVIGGRGGAGASTLATALAVTGARAGLRTMLVDADPLGGGLDLMLRCERTAGLRWPALSAGTGQADAPALVEGIPTPGDLVVLSWDRGDVMTVPAESMATALDAGRRGRDLVVVDLPRQLTDAAAVALQTADHTWVVVPTELRAAVAAARVASVVDRRCPGVSVVVRAPVPRDLTAAGVAQALGLPLAGILPPEPGLSRALERGEPPAGTGRGPLAGLCRRLLSDLMRPAQDHDRSGALQCLIPGMAGPCASGKDGTA
jgi:secretion/DNA translocation related CpaE-like protein